MKKDKDTNNSEQKAEKKKGSLKKKILLSVIVAALLTAAFFLWFYWPVFVINKAFKNDDYEIIVSEYSKVRTQKDRIEIKEKSLDKVEKYYNAYVKESKKYKEVDRFYKIMMSEEFGEEDAFLEYRDKLEIIKASRDSYEEGENYYKKYNYLEAIKAFEKVVKEDKAYRRRADAYITDCTGKYIDQVLIDTDELLQGKLYKAAVVAMEDALENFPDDKRLKEKYQLVLEEYNKVEGADKDIRGIWSVEYDMGDTLAYYLGITGYDIVFPLQMVFEIDDRNIKMYVDREGIKPALQYLTENSMDALYEVADSYGISRSQADTFVKWTYGGSYPDFIMDYFESDINSALNEASFEYSYTLDDNEIIITGKEGNTVIAEYKCSGGIFVINSISGDDPGLGEFDYPLTLERR